LLPAAVARSRIVENRVVEIQQEDAREHDLDATFAG
jgi:hypothetical protein